MSEARLLTSVDQNALRFGEKHNVASDGLNLMNNLCQWDNPPAYDDRWIKKVAGACEVASAYAALVKQHEELLKSIAAAPDLESAKALALNFTPNLV